MFSIIQAAGWPIWPLVACSIAALALIIERFSSLKIPKVAPPQLLNEAIIVSRDSVPLPDVVSKLEQNSLLGEVLASGLQALSTNPQISEDDLRQTVSIGPNRAAASKEPAAEAGFAPFNSTAPTVEWRAVDGKPFAIIQRWLIADNNDLDKAGTPTSKPVLAVTRLPPGPVCHVAYIDGQANRNANELARQAADEFARDFKCGKDEVKVIGEKGAAVSLAKR